MRIEITGKNLQITDSLRDTIEKKLSKLDRYFTSDIIIYVNMSVVKGKQIVEVTIPVKGGIIRSEQGSDDMYVSIDLVEEIIERQIKKYKSKLIARHHKEESSFSPEFIESEDETVYDEGDIRIVRTKRFENKPMYPEDACIQMELLGHSFFVFENAESGKVSVVYKRKDGAYGLIEPEY